MRKNFWNNILFGIGILGILFQSLILILVYKKNGGTTGGDLFTLALPFLVSLIIGVYVLVSKKENTNRKLNFAAITVSIFGCFLPYWMEKTGILVQYERWLRNEQSVNTEDLGLRLLGFIGVELLVILAILFGKSEEPNFKSGLR